MKMTERDLIHLYLRNSCMQHPDKQRDNLATLKNQLYYLVKIK